MFFLKFNTHGHWPVTLYFFIFVAELKNNHSFKKAGVHNIDLFCFKTTLMRGEWGEFSNLLWVEFGCYRCIWLQLKYQNYSRDCIAASSNCHGGAIGVHLEILWRVLSLSQFDLDLPIYQGCTHFIVICLDLVNLFQWIIFQNLGSGISGKSPAWFCSVQCELNHTVYWS